MADKLKFGTDQKFWSVSYNLAKDILFQDLPPNSQKEDFLYYWKFHPTSVLIIKYAYYYFLLCQLLEMLAPLNWCYQCLQKFMVYSNSYEMEVTHLHFWKVWHNALITRSNLLARQIPISNSCDTCDSQEEYVQHIFRFCPNARHVN